MNFPEKNILDTWLEENKNSEIDQFIERNLAITEKISLLLKERGISQADFAKKLGKSPSEISKWLTGLHNLTLKSITKMEVALGVDLINIESQYKYVYLGSIKGDGAEEKIDDYQEASAYQEVS